MKCKTCACVPAKVHRGLRLLVGAGHVVLAVLAGEVVDAREACLRETRVDVFCVAPYCIA